MEFKGEEGADQGGLTRDFLTQLGKELFNPDCGLFAVSSNKVTIQPSVNSACVPYFVRIFYFVGQLMAKNLLENNFMEANFTIPFLK